MFRRKRKATDFGAEIEAHIQLEKERLREQGLSEEDALTAAHRAFGNVTKAEERFYESGRWLWWDRLWQDIRYALRMLRKSPSFTAVALVTLALAIGANAVVFAALNALVLRPLNLPRAGSLYGIHRASDHSGNQSYPDYLDLRDRNRSFEDLAAYTGLQVGLDTGENASRAWVCATSGNYFDVLGVQPHLGRFFHASDERGPNSAPYIVLSHAYWQSRFQSDRGVVGRVVQLNKHPFTILGVAPPGFTGPLLIFTPDFFLPIVNQEQVEGRNVLNARGIRWVFATVGHLKVGVTPEQAAADVNAISADLQKTYPRDHAAMTLVLARPSLYGDFLGRPVRAFLTALLLLAGLILLAACANLGSLFAARAADRSREVALRLALGAGRIRILRQLFTEAILISLVGGAIGLWGSVVLLRWLGTWKPFPPYPINIPIQPDANVYAIALLLALASGFLFGVVPVRQVLHTDAYEIVKSGSRSTVERGLSARDLLVGVQIAICAVLVTASLVAVRGLVRSLDGDFGFEPRNAMLVNTVLDMAGYRGDAVPAMQKRMTDAMETIPGVTAVALVDSPPLSRGGLRASMVFTDQTTDLVPANAAARPSTYRISPGYLRAAGTALLSGRAFTWDDDKEAPRVALINREFARKIFGSATDAMGRYFKVRDGTRTQVVGVVEDGKYRNLTEEQRPAMFIPILQSPSSETSVVVRSNGDAQQLAAAIRSKLRELDAGLPAHIQTWDQTMDFPLFPSRVAAVSLGILGVMGAMLSITGIFGLAAYSVSKRLRELGIRIALGAQRKEVLQAALGRAFMLLGFGSAAGLLLGILASRVLASIVYQATPRDPLVLVGVVLAMLSLGLIATWIPVQRALSIDPLILLREE